MFNQLNTLPSDPLLGLIALFREDVNPLKVDLGVGVYKDETGHTPIMAAVQKATRQHIEIEDSKAYLGPVGVSGFVEGIKQLVLGKSSAALHDGRVAGMQTPGGCGALKIGAELLKRATNNPTVWVSDPTWANHIPLIRSAGLNIKTYPYFDTQSNEINFETMDKKLAKLGPSDIVLLHGCCHNPTGADLSIEQWQQISKRAVERGFVPFIDIAYQGLGDGIESDVKGVQHLSQSVEEMLIATSCSKNFGLYRERIGSLLVQSKNACQTNAVQTHIQDAARANYSMPPAFGGFLVERILNDTQLKAEWEQELSAMAKRIKNLRSKLVESIQQQGIYQDFSFITRQKGMFSFLGINQEQVKTLREKYSIYMADSSRINIAGLSTQCVDYVTSSLKTVL